MELPTKKAKKINCNVIWREKFIRLHLIKVRELLAKNAKTFPCLIVPGIIPPELQNTSFIRVFRLSLTSDGLALG
jgi:hypothetical protein